MPIEFFDSPNGPSVRQSFDAPTVYLDHWAIRLFSDEVALQDRFVAELLRKKGTLLLSHLSLAEFAAATDARHCIAAEEFLERLLPNVFFTDFDYRKVLAREQSERNNRKRFWPPADLPQLKFFAERAQSSKLGFTMRGFISLTHLHRSGIEPLLATMASGVLAALEAARNDPNYVAKARNVPPSDQRLRTTLIFGELMRGFNLDAKALIKKNDVIDLVHAAMPLNCCDYVLLDAAWAERVEKMKQRIHKSAMTMAMAKCFSQRNDGIEAFLADLHAFDHAAQVGAPVP